MKKYFSIVLAILVVFSIICFGFFFFWRHSKKTEPPSSPAKGMFEWREETVENPQSVQALIQELEITKWYQEFPEEWDKEIVSNFSKLMHKQETAVYALFGAVDWGYESDGATLISHLNQVTRYNETADEDARIDGVMIDVEPYTSSRWKKNREGHMKNYVDGMLKAYQSVQGQNLQFIICIPRHYDEQGLGKDLERLIANGCDEVAVMNYDCGNEVEKIETEANLAQKYGKELHCILEFQEVGKHGLVEEKTYHNKGIKAAWKAWESVDAAYPKLSVTWDYHYTKSLIHILNRELKKSD